MNITDIIDGTFALFLPMLIVIFSLLGTVNGLKYICCANKEDKYRWIFITFTIISVWTAAIFSYVTVQAFSGYNIISPDSFGALFIRPLNLLISVSIAVLLRTKYIEKHNGGKECQPIHKN